jgi:hypothetical protein
VLQPSTESALAKGWDALPGPAGDSVSRHWDVLGVGRKNKGRSRVQGRIAMGESAQQMHAPGTYPCLEEWQLLKSSSEVWIQLHPQHHS